MAPWAFLTASGSSLLFTANTFRPARGLLRIPAFFAAWLVNELALYALLWQAIAALALAEDGVFRSWPGRIGLAAWGLSLAGIAVLWVRGHHAERTMREALGDWAGAEPGPRVPAYKQLFPFAPGRSNVRRIRDVVYGEASGKALKLDVYLPRKEGKRRPAILQIHGGAWVIGDKREQGLPLLYHLSAQGWVGFNVNYRLSPKATFPDHLVDVKRAIAWIREHADEYGVDPGFVCVTGGSAGGHLSALAALTAGDPSYQPGFEHADTSVQGAVPFYGIYCFVDRLGVYPREFVGVLLERLVMKTRLADEPHRFREASPLDRVHEQAPPMLVVHGDNDTLAPVEYARHFVEALRRVSSGPVLYAEVQGAQHAFDVFLSPRTARVIEGVERFLTGLHRRHLAGSALTG